MLRKITLLAAMCIGLYANSFAQSFTEDFESTTAPALPSGWVQTTAGSAKGWVTSTGAITFATYLMPAHTKYAVVNDWNEPTGFGVNTNTILKSPVFSLVGVTNPHLKYDVFYLNAAASASVVESGTVAISQDGGSTWTTIDQPAGNLAWNTRYVDLSTYATGTNLMLGFIYKDAGTKLAGMAIDNVSVYTPPANDLSFATLDPVAGDPRAFGVAGSSLTLGGTVLNLGLSTVTSYAVNYQINGGAVQAGTTQTANILPFTTGTFTQTITLPATLGTLPVKIWVTNAGDVDNTNDTANTSVIVSAFTPKKKLTYEEGTGSWCGFCVRGIVYMDSLWHQHPSDVSIIAVHNQTPSVGRYDAMQIPAYDNYMSSHYFSSYPNLAIDRTYYGIDPDQAFDAYSALISSFGYADITLSNVAFSAGNKLSLDVAVKPAIDLNGDYRLALVLTEDDVTGTGQGWNQENYYSGGGYGPLDGFESKPSIITGTKFQFVARYISNVTGDAGSLPTTMTASSTYTHSYTNVPVDFLWHTYKMRAIVMLMRASDGVVLNSNYATIPLGVTNVEAGVAMFKVWPNPATTETNLSFTLREKGNVNVSVVDAIGRTVYTTAQSMSAGIQQLTIPTASLANGLYSINIQTETGKVTERLSVVK